MNDLYVIATITIILCIIVASYLMYTISKRNRIRYDVERMRFTKEFLKDLDNTIIVETIRKIKYSTMLGEKLIPRDFDEFITEICNRVYKAYDKKIYTNKNMLYDRKYIFRYIHNKAVIIYYDYLFESEVDNTED